MLLQTFTDEEDTKGRLLKDYIGESEGLEWLRRNYKKDFVLSKVKTVILVTHQISFLLKLTHFYHDDVFRLLDLK